MEVVPFYKSSAELFDYDKYREMWGGDINGEDTREAIPISWVHKESTFYLYHDDRNSLLVSKYSTKKRGYMFIVSMPYNIRGSKKEALLFLKKFLEEHKNISIHFSLTKKWLAYLLRAIELLEIDTHEIMDVEIYDYTYNELLEEKLEIMRTAKWKKDKTRGLLKDPNVSFRKLDYEDFDNIKKLFLSWNRSTKDNARPTFYKNIFDSNFAGLELFGLFYKDTLILVEGIIPMGKNAYSLFAFGVSSTELGLKLGIEIPKKVITYMNLTFRYLMYEQLVKEGYEIADAGFLGSLKDTEGLREHKKSTYINEIPKYSGLLKTKLGGKTNDRF